MRKNLKNVKKPIDTKVERGYNVDKIKMIPIEQEDEKMAPRVKYIVEFDFTVDENGDAIPMQMKGFASRSAIDAWRAEHEAECRMMRVLTVIDVE